MSSLLNVFHVQKMEDAIKMVNLSAIKASSMKVMLALRTNLSDNRPWVSSKTWNKCCRSKKDSTCAVKLKAQISMLQRFKKCSRRVADRCIQAMKLTISGLWRIKFTNSWVIKSMLQLLTSTGQPANLIREISLFITGIKTKIFHSSLSSLAWVSSVM